MGCFLLSVTEYNPTCYAQTLEVHLIEFRHSHHKEVLMEEPKWKLGDPCYVADVNIEKGRMRFRVMPACVVHVADRVATAQSTNPFSKSNFGRWEPFTEGRPFPDRRSALVHVLKEMQENGISLLTPILAEGEAPQIKNLPANIPTIGEVVYGYDIETREVFEAQIGYLRYEYGRLDVGYDQSPGNPEASNVRIKEWWSTREEAEAHARQHHGGRWTFVSKEELAARVNAEIDKIWSDAAKYHASPEGQASMRSMGEFFRQV